MEQHIFRVMATAMTMRDPLCASNVELQQEGSPVDRRPTPDTAVVGPTAIWSVRASNSSCFRLDACIRCG